MDEKTRAMFVERHRKLRLVEQLLASGERPFRYPRLPTVDDPPDAGIRYIECTYDRRRRKWRMEYETGGNPAWEKTAWDVATRLLLRTETEERRREATAFLGFE